MIQNQNHDSPNRTGTRTRSADDTWDCSFHQQSRTSVIILTVGDEGFSFLHCPRLSSQQEIQTPSHWLDTTGVTEVELQKRQKHPDCSPGEPQSFSWTQKMIRTGRRSICCLWFTQHSQPVQPQSRPSVKCVCAGKRIILTWKITFSWACPLWKTQYLHSTCVFGLHTYTDRLTQTHTHFCYRRVKHSFSPTD